MFQVAIGLTLLTIKAKVNILQVLNLAMIISHMLEIRAQVRHQFALLLINMNRPFVSFLTINVTTNAYISVRPVAIGVVNHAITHHKRGLQVDPRPMSQHVIMKILMGLFLQLHDPE